MIAADKVLIGISGWGSDERIFRELFAHCPELQDYRHIFLPWQDLIVEGKARAALQQDWDEVLFLGWSLGSLLCLELALDLDLTKAALILLSPSAAMGVNPLVLKLMQRRLKTQRQQVLLDFAKNCGEGDFVPFYLEQASSFTEASLHAGLDYLLHCDLRGSLELDFPCLLVSGQQDKIIPTSQAVELAQLLPRTELLQIEAGHNLLIPPAEGLVGTIKRFLAKL